MGMRRHVAGVGAAGMRLVPVVGIAITLWHHVLRGGVLVVPLRFLRHHMVLRGVVGTGIRLRFARTQVHVRALSHGVEGGDTAHLRTLHGGIVLVLEWIGGIKRVIGSHVVVVIHPARW